MGSGDSEHYMVLQLDGEPDIELQIAFSSYHQKDWMRPRSWFVMVMVMRTVSECATAR